MNQVTRDPIVDVARLMDEGRWSGYQKRLVCLTSLTIIFDGFDNQLLGIALPAIMRDWGVARASFAPVVSLGYLGMMLGAVAAGRAGDRFGRRSTLLACMLLFGVTTVAIAGADSLAMLAALRFAAGVGLGGAMPNAASLAAEYVPLRQRPLAVTLAIVCIPLGGAVAGLFAVPALPAVGWRGMFAIGGAIPIAGALLLLPVLPESPRFLARQNARASELGQLLRRMGHNVPQDAVFTDASAKPGTTGSFRTLFTPEFRADTLALWTAFFSCLLAVYLGFAWLPSILTSAGLGAAVASTSLTAFNLGGVAGAIAGGKLITRFGSRPTMLTMASGAIAGAVAMSLLPINASTPVAAIIVMLTITGGLINAVQTTMYALAAHVYPTSVRSTGVGTSNAVGRSGAILSGFAGPAVLEYGGSASFFAAMAAAMCLTFVSLAVMRRHVPARAAPG